MTFWEELSAPFEPSEIDWRIGATNEKKEGNRVVTKATKGLALAYMDARAVMNRLDKVCGPDGWQCRYPIISEGKTVCEIGIYVPGPAVWLWKSDGAGDSDIEGAKGALSAAFKRAAGRWGIGRYLYALDSPWVAIEPRGRSYAIKKSEFKVLNRLLLGGSAILDMKPPTVAELKAQAGDFKDRIEACPTVEALDKIVDLDKALIIDLKAQKPDWWHGPKDESYEGLIDVIEKKRNELEEYGRELRAG